MWDGGPTDSESGAKWITRIRVMEQIGWEETDHRPFFELAGFDLDEDLRPMLRRWLDYEGGCLADDTREQIRIHGAEEYDSYWMPGETLEEAVANIDGRVERSRRTLGLIDAVFQRVMVEVRGSRRLVA